MFRRDCCLHRQRNVSTASAWIGLHLSTSSGTVLDRWEWDDGTQLTYSNLEMWKTLVTIIANSSTVSLKTSNSNSISAQTSNMKETASDSATFISSTSLYDEVTSQCLHLSAMCVEMSAANGTWNCDLCNSTQRALCEMTAGNNERLSKRSF